MGFYGEQIFPRAMDWMLRTPEVGAMRRRALARARGEVLEIGFGTALNLAHYPDAVVKVVGLDPLDALEARVQRRIGEASFPVERVGLPADGRLPFEDDRFDTVVSTYTLCSIPDVARALAELRRVLAPQGELLYLEHGISDDPRVARYQRLLNPVQKVIGCGCQLIRQPHTLVEEAGFHPVERDHWVEPGPRILSEMYSGAARRQP